MSIIEHTTIITPATVRNMKRGKLEDSLLLFANKSVSDDAEIERLKAELELRTKERDGFHQLIDAAYPKVQLLAESGEVSLICSYWLEDVGEELETVSSFDDSELFAHLAGRGSDV